MDDYMEHSNRKLDLTVTDDGLAAVIKFLARMDTGKDINGEDPFKRQSTRLCLAYRMGAGGNGVYLTSTTAEDTDMDEPDWTKMPAGLHPKKTARTIRKLMKNVPWPPSDCEGMTEKGWRILEPMAAAWDDDAESEPEDVERAFAYVTPWTCEYSK